MSQTMPVTQEQPPSAKAEQFAGTYQLGSFQQDFGVKLTKMTIFSGVISAIITGVFGFLSFQMLNAPRNINDVNNAPIVIGVGVLFLLGAIYCFLYPTIYSSWHVYIYTEGFAFARGSKVDAFRWDQVDAIWQSITRRYVNGIYTGTTYKYTIRGIDSRQVVLTNRITDIAKLGGIISDMITRVKLPEMVAAFRAGSTLSFSTLSVNSQGVSNGKELVSWDQIKKIEVNNGTVTVKKEGKWLSWSSVQVSKIPNFFIFMALVNAIMNKFI
jgi:Family of unknown function (DUF6585)